MQLSCYCHDDGPCGKGKSICCAARSVVREVVGIDMSPDLLAIARANVASLRGKRSPVRLALSLAEEFDYSGVTVVYLFNPFGARTLSNVLCKLQHAAQERGVVRIAYVQPVHESVFREQPWLEEIDRWQPFKVFAQRCAVSFWRSRA
jgi:predicted RNA methylase